MKKRGIIPCYTTIIDSSVSSSSSSSSCVDDFDDHNKKTCKPKRVARKRVSINSKSIDKKCPSNVSATTSKRSSIYRGVTRHRWTGRFEAHLWDKSSWNNVQTKKGRQVYLGAYDSEVDAARTYDLAALKYWGPDTTLNSPIENYTKELEEMQNASKEEYLASLRRRSSGFSRGVSKYRGVARHHHNGRWEARIGRVLGNKYLYLGTFSSQEEAAVAYDLAAIEYRGTNAVTNFDISNYIGRVKSLIPDDQLQLPSPSQITPLEETIIEPPKNEEQLYELDLHQQQCLQEFEQQELITTMPFNKYEDSKLVSSIDFSSLLVMNPEDDSTENPWSFCLDNGDYAPHLVHDIPIEEDGRILDLFDQTGFDDNIDSIF